jgi:hypothetical protein
MAQRIDIRIDSSGLFSEIARVVAGELPERSRKH